MSFTRSRTQILYRYVPGAIFEHDRYGICRVTDVAVSAPGRLNIETLKEALKSLFYQWQGNGMEDFPDPNMEWDEYQVGVPERVYFEPFPTVVECRACGHIHFLNTLAQIGGDPVCTVCRQGRYRQLAYMMIHACGKLTPMFVPNCQTHGNANARFNDTGRFVTSWWSCASCNGATISRMTQLPCGCSYGRRTNNVNMRYVRSNDTSILYSHTVPFVNLQEGLLDKLIGDPRSMGLLLARAWNLIADKATDIAGRREAAGNTSVSNDRARALVQRLLVENPDSESAKQLQRILDQSTQLPGDDAIDQVENLVGRSLDSKPNRSLLEYVAILDTLDVLSPDIAASNARQRGDDAGAFDIEAAMEYSREMLGIGSIRCITNFPLALAAVGYSRVANRPGETLIRPFRRGRSEGGKTPVYVVTSETEAIMIQLDPCRVVQWLIANGMANGPVPAAGLDSWTWCRQNLPGLSVIPGLFYIPPTTSISERAVLTLLHTISHLLLKCIEWSGFDPESVGEYTLPDMLTVIIHSNNYNAFTIGGMVTMFEQRLLGWLRDAYNAAFTCTYNPICRDDGASCAGCLHRQHNCESFNSLLSRSTLEGGIAADLPEIVMGYWTLR